jgi:hypothetical protein
MTASALGITRKIPAGAAGDHEQPTSVRDRLRSRRGQLAKGSTRLFVVPGYDDESGPLGGQLVVRYRRMLFDELTDAFRRDRWIDENGHVDTVAANVQFLVDSCDEILIREPDGTLTPLVEGHKTTYTVNLDTGESLGTVMGVDDLPTIRAQLVAEFGDNELTLNDHSGEVHRWMVSANDLDAETALGEASAR